MPFTAPPAPRAVQLAPTPARARGTYLTPGLAGCPAVRYEVWTSDGRCVAEGRLAPDVLTPVTVTAFEQWLDAIDPPHPYLVR